MEEQAQKNGKANKKRGISQGSGMDTLQKKLGALEQEKHILLELSNDLTTVREKNDLIKIFSSRLKGFFYFSHAVVSLIDKKEGAYQAFLIDKSAIAITHRSELPALLQSKFPIADPFIGQLGDSNGPVSFLLEDIMEKPGIPAFLKINYECGIKRAMIAGLVHKEETMGYVFVYSNRTDPFSDTFTNVLQGILPHLANAVSNIMANQKIEYRDEIQKALLSLSTDMVMVRDRDKLSSIFKFGLSKLLYFTHSILTVRSPSGTTYEPFLLDPDSRTTQLAEYTQMINTPTPIADGFYNVAAESKKAVDFDLSTIDMENAPLWVQLNWKGGIKEILIKALSPKKDSKYNLILFSDRPKTFDQRAVDIIDQLAGQLATAASNVAANEEITQKERDKSFLLEFSRDIALSRTKKDLSEAIHGSLKKLSNIKAYFIRVLDPEGASLSSFMFDEDVYYLKDENFVRLLKTKIPVDNGITGKVMKGTGPVFFDLAEEAEKGHSGIYIDYWKSLGPRRFEYKNIVGTPLRLGNKTLGILWVITPDINTDLLDGISAQISVVISNVLANEEIVERDKEKTILLSLSGEIAALRSRQDLLQVFKDHYKRLFAVEGFGITTINDDGLTYSPFIVNSVEKVKAHPDYEKVITGNYKITDPIFQQVITSDNPVILDVMALAKDPASPPFVKLWKIGHLQKVMAMALRVGGKNIGMLILFLPQYELVNVKVDLLKAVCAQLSVAVANILANERVQSYKRMLEVENDYLREQILTNDKFSEIIGNGPAMQKVFKMISLVADSDSTTLLLGETGTGKELIAKAIHNASLRKNKLMVKVNCAALATNLIESELFGHEKGSFTGAVERRIGKFELANKGTLFLDEIGEMPLETQVKLLRVIQERELERVGGSTTIKVDVRIIAATNRNLEEEVKAGRFRSDLYYRLNVFPITLPPLRERIGDIEPLAEFFLNRYSLQSGKTVTGIAPKAMAKLKAYHWPGNIRELEHLIERSVLLAEGRILQDIHLPHQTGDEGLDNLHLINKTLEEMERAYIIEVLKRCSGKIAGSGGASELLDLPSTTLHSKIKKLGILKEEYIL